MTGRENERLKDLATLTKATRFLLYGGAAVAVLSLGSNLLEAGFLTDVRTGAFWSEGQALAAAESNDARQGVVALL